MRETVLREERVLIRDLRDRLRLCSGQFCRRASPSSNRIRPSVPSSTTFLMSGPSCWQSHYMPTAPSFSSSSCSRPPSSSTPYHPIPARGERSPSVLPPRSRSTRPRPLAAALPQLVTFCRQSHLLPFSAARSWLSLAWRSSPLTSAYSHGASPRWRHGERH